MALQQYKIEWHFAYSEHTWAGEYALMSEVESTGGYQIQHNRMLDAYRAIEALVKRQGGWCAMYGRTFTPQEYPYHIGWVKIRSHSGKDEDVQV